MVASRVEPGVRNWTVASSRGMESTDVQSSGQYFVGIRVVSFTKRKWSYHLSMESGKREPPFHPLGSQKVTARWPLALPSTALHGGSSS